MKPLYKYMVPLLASGIIIPICQMTGALLNEPIVKPAAVRSTAPPAPKKPRSGFSFKDDVAAKLIPVLKYF